MHDGSAMFMEEDYADPYGWMDMRYDTEEEEYLESVLTHPEHFAPARGAGERMVGAYPEGTY